MLRNFLILTIICVFSVSGIYAQKKDTKSVDETAIRGILMRLETAWTGGDGKKFGEEFAEDADFTVWNGMYLKGRKTIAEGHQHIFDTIYKDTKLRFNIRQIRFLRDDVAVVHATGVVAKKSAEFPATPMVVPVFVFSNENGKWQITAFQNTQLQPPDER